MSKIRKKKNRNNKAILLINMNTNETCLCIMS